MKHLRRYNESKLVDLEVLQDFCDLNLVYLLDEDFVINIEEPHDAGQWRGCHCIWIEQEDPQNSFTWDSVKDFIIPFLEKLSKRFELPTELKDPITLDGVHFNSSFLKDCRANRFKTIYFNK